MVKEESSDYKKVRKRRFFVEPKMYDPSNRAGFGHRFHVLIRFCHNENGRIQTQKDSKHSL